MKRIIPIVILGILIASSIGYSETISTCLNDTHSEQNISLSINNSGSSSDIEITEVELCQFNCSIPNGQCNPSPYDVDMGDIGIPIGLVGIAAIFAYLAFTTHTRHEPLQFLYLGLTFIFIIVSLATMINISRGGLLVEGMLSGAYWAGITGFVIFGVYFILMFIYKVVLSVKTK